MKRFEGKAGIVTGASSGIGAAAAKQFAAEGASVVLAARREAEGEQIAGEIRAAGGECCFVRTDVAQAEDVRSLVAQTVKTYGQIDFAFNNAGTEGKFAPLSELSEADFDFTIDVNLKGVWLALKYEIEQMQKQGTGGAIVNTSSWLAKGGLAGSSIYSASKGALDSMTRAVVLEVAADNIRVNNINPGIIDTEMLRRFFNPDEQPENPFTAHTPAKRLGTAAEAAAVAVWLCSDEARFVSGESILVDGGFAIPGFRL